MSGDIPKTGQDRTVNINFFVSTYSHALNKFPLKLWPACLPHIIQVKHRRQPCKFKINFVILLFYAYSCTSYNPKFEKKKIYITGGVSGDWCVKGTGCSGPFDILCWTGH